MVMDKEWKHIPPSFQAAQLANEMGSSLLIAQLLLNRGISDKRSAESFLSPKLSDLMDPMLLKGMDEAVGAILEVIHNRERITIYGDYDADGITATALLVNFFSSIGIPASPYIPHRILEGYGLNPEAIRKIARDGTGLIITVDCGISNAKEIHLARQFGMKIIITDHHRIPMDFEPICPVINPHQADSLFPFRDLAGVGVAFYLAMAMRTALRENGWFRHAPEPDLKNYLDLVALGTVADMVPLTGQNRILVHSGILAMQDTVWPGIKVMQEAAGMVASNASSYDLAFKFAPRLNAAGRLDNPMISLEVLVTDRLSVAMEKVEQLSHLNSLRQAIEKDILKEIEETIIPRMDMEKTRIMIFSREGWHQGVLGIVASKLLDRYYRPTIVLTIRDGKATGSGRSIDGFDLHHALERFSHLFERFGGHHHAAGLSLKASNMEALKAGLEEMALEALSEEDLIPTVKVDAPLRISDLSINVMREIQALAPFGSGNSEPVLFTDSLDVLWSGIVGENHLKLKVKQGSRIMDAIGFGLAACHPLNGKVIDMVFTPKMDQWQGCERIQLHIIDLEMKS
jgi:single-stranded-DNA-specific exonuclease